jgi:2-polyprenyl-3-methyl-5-hydroxy-6-metoxy-1,4-benzoquinol methylase
MSNQQRDIPEYGWQDTSPTGAHSYLLPTVERAINNYLQTHSVPPSSLQLFDAGCGNGFLASHFSQRGFTVAGCDASEQGIAQSRQACPAGQFEVMSVYENLADKFGNDGACGATEI